VRAAILLGAVVTGAVVLLPGSAAGGRQKPYVLTALADIGTLYWRYDCVHFRSPEWSLGIRVFRDTATTSVTYRDAGLTRRRTVQPDGPTIWFPFRRQRSQSLSLVQFTEPGTLHGRVVAKFGRRDCQSYFPPRLSVQLYPR
jgi:hypothetical protein